MLEDILNKATNHGKNLLLVGMIAASTLMPSKAEAQNRYISFDADPAAFGINGETIDMTEFEVQYFKIPTDNNKIGFRMYNKTQPENYVEIRGIIPLPPGEAFTIDGVAALPYITVDPNTIGSVAPPTEMPGSNPGIDNIYELDSGLLAGSQFFRLRNNQGTVNFYLDLDSADIFNDYQMAVIEGSVLEWNRIPAGYSFTTPLTTFNTYHSSAGDPPGWSPRQTKTFRIRGVYGMINEGEIDLYNSEIRLSESATENVTDNETFSAMVASLSSPFKGITFIPPDAYLLMVRMQNNSDIRDDFGGFQMPILPIGIYIDPNGVGWGMYAPNADDGSGVFPGSVNLDDLVQKDMLDADGSVISTIYEPPVANETSSFGEVKATYK